MDAKNVSNQNEIVMYRVYLQSYCRRDSLFMYDINEFEQKSRFDQSQYTIKGFLKYLNDNQKLTYDYCSHFELYFNHILQRQEINLASHFIYNAILNFLYSTKNYLPNNDYIFEENNFYTISYIEEDDEDYYLKLLFQEIADKGAAVWLNHKGKICIRFSVESAYKEYSTIEAGRVLSNFMHTQIKFTEDSLSNDESKAQNIPILYLQLIHDEVFNTQIKKEFFKLIIFGK